MFAEAWQASTTTSKTIKMILHSLCFVIKYWQYNHLYVYSLGIMGLYNGISASLMRQLTYSMVRFGIYEFAKQEFASKDVSEHPNFTI